MTKIIKKFAPIVIFVYNRPWHTRQTVESLKKNIFANQSDLIIFSDAAKTFEANAKVQEVREYLKTIGGFNSVYIVEREENLGLAKSIIQGVTEIVKKYGKIIVLEDDIVTSPAFLQFMNQALEFYENDRKVWHISGWNYPIDTDSLGDVFLWRLMNCWGWATWSDRWLHYEKNPEALIKKWSIEEKFQFDLDGSGLFWSQVEANAAGKINTWAIFWYATIFQNKGLCLNPSVSYVENIGHDGSGEHCGNETGYSIDYLCQKKQLNFSIEYFESQQAVSRIIEFYKKNKKPFYIRIINKISRFFSGENLMR